MISSFVIIIQLGIKLLAKNFIHIILIFCSRVQAVQNVHNNFSSRHHALARTYIYRLAFLANGQQMWREHEEKLKIETQLKKLDPLVVNLFQSRLAAFPHKAFLTPLDMNYVTEIKYTHFVLIACFFWEEKNLKKITIKKKLVNHSIWSCSSEELASFAASQILARSPLKKVAQRSSNSAKASLRTRKLVSHSFISFICNISFFFYKFLHGYFKSVHKDELLNYRIIELEVNAGSFLYKMIRKMIGLVVDVSRGRYKPEIVKDMLANPKNYYDFNESTILKPNGLFLKQVHYSPSDFTKPRPICRISEMKKNE